MLNKLHLESNTTYAYMPTICNDKPYGKETIDTKVGGESNFYKIGIEIKLRRDGKIILSTWTIYEGYHILNSATTLDKEGKLVPGERSSINCFGLGWMYADQEWVDEFLEDLEITLESGDRQWKMVRLGGTFL